MATEPMNLREWSPRSDTFAGGRLFTCGRPGRAVYGTAWREVPIDVIDDWLSRLPQANVVHLVSLLGQKRKGDSEFFYYPFRSEHEADERPTFQAWLDERRPHRFVVHEFPTTDMRGIPDEVLFAVTERVRSLLAAEALVVVIDSAGAERTARVCEELGFRR